jgi:hypothetical protein
VQWYRGEKVAALVLEYYVLLRSILRAKPLLRKCLCRCRHCRIFFLSHPRNAGRCDLGCPFGCREAHRRKESIRRSTDYYRGEDGRKYKRRQNQRQDEKRRARAAAQDPPGGVPPGTPVKQDPSPEPKTLPDGPQLSPGREQGEQALPKVLPEALVDYVRMAVSLIEDRPVSRAEIIEMLRRVFRQRSMSRRRQIDQAVDWLHENPP